VKRLQAAWASSLFGLVVGLVVGLAYTWLIDPLQPVNTDPSYLDAACQKEWVRLLALSYVVDPDLQRAHARLDGLAQDDVAAALGEMIEEYSAAGHPARTMRRLTSLADALDVYTPAMLAYLQSPTATSVLTPSPGAPPATRTPATSTLPGATPTPTEIPSTPTYTPLPAADYQVSSREELCGPAESARFEVIVTDALGDGLPGVIVWLVWPGGAQRAVTGLKPDRGAGYADFGAEQGQTYSLGVGEVGLALVDGLTIEACSTDADEGLVGSWRIVLEPRQAGE
jgi:hypothetical protein